jgi:histidinol-phosphatase (PHP family)
VIDYHIHTSHSIDATGTLTEYCQKAIQIGLDEICFTNHCELDPHRNDSFIRFNGTPEPLSRARLIKLQNEIFEVRDRFKGKGLSVKFGIEVGYDRGIENAIGTVLDDLELDFVIGAIHCLDHICIDSSRECGKYFNRHNAEQYINNYLDALSGLVRSRLFDSIAHIDVYKKYGLGHYGQDIYDVRKDAIAEVFRLIKKHDIAMEINTAGMRFMNEFYPAPAIMKIAQESGLDAITLGSDSHKPADLGKDLAPAVDYLRSFGFRTVQSFDRRKPTPLNI